MSVLLKVCVEPSDTKGAVSVVLEHTGGSSRIGFSNNEDTAATIFVQGLLFRPADQEQAIRVPINHRYNPESFLRGQRIYLCIRRTQNTITCLLNNEEFFKGCFTEQRLLKKFRFLRIGVFSSGLASFASHNLHVQETKASLDFSRIFKSIKREVYIRRGRFKTRQEAHLNPEVSSEQGNTVGAAGVVGETKVEAEHSGQDETDKMRSCRSVYEPYIDSASLSIPRWAACSQDEEANTYSDGEESGWVSPPSFAGDHSQQREEMSSLTDCLSGNRSPFSDTRSPFQSPRPIATESEFSPVIEACSATPDSTVMTPARPQSFSTTCPRSHASFLSLTGRLLPAAATVTSMDECLAGLDDFDAQSKTKQLDTEEQSENDFKWNIVQLPNTHNNTNNISGSSEPNNPAKQQHSEDANALKSSRPDASDSYSPKLSPKDEWCQVEVEEAQS
eukprot:CAMPEP_0175100170 /NCGR_PEP_ID=MMETSP0086_2-20121207/6923_1 /TAXON_ID=136419 /ORGANISM="Unknown Unknown, Strain D1" /LENGTH=446 /DNA_ID=CAMNT_0016374221 /DNA_START=189 /DNA_END=1529 /DNA_ORIENTATION=-